MFCGVGKITQWNIITKLLSSRQKSRYLYIIHIDSIRFFSPPIFYLFVVGGGGGSATAACAFSVECSNSSGDSIRSLCAKTLATATTNKKNYVNQTRERKRETFFSVAFGGFLFLDRTSHVIKHQIIIRWTMVWPGPVVVLSVIKSFIIQLKFLYVIPRQWLRWFSVIAVMMYCYFSIM